MLLVNVSPNPVGSDEVRGSGPAGGGPTKFLRRVKKEASSSEGSREQRTLYARKEVNINVMIDHSTYSTILFCNMASQVLRWKNR